MPNEWDGVPAWSDLMTWRHHVYEMMSTALRGPQHGEAGQQVTHLSTPYPTFF